jgi:hypothetical protein
MYDNVGLITGDFEEKATRLECGDSAWIFKAKSGRDQSLLTKLDTIAATMPNTEKTNLRKGFRT